MPELTLEEWRRLHPFIPPTPEEKKAAREAEIDMFGAPLSDLLNDFSDPNMAGELLQWSASLPGTLRENLSDQIKAQAQKQGVPLREFVDYLFGAPNANVFMLRLQL